MNERIKQILLQVVPLAGEDGEYLPSLHTPEDIKQFAELIVRECLNICQELVDDGLSEAETPKWMIKEHFGVKE